MGDNYVWLWSESFAFISNWCSSCANIWLLSWSRLFGMGGAGKPTKCHHKNTHSCSVRTAGNSKHKGQKHQLKAKLSCKAWFICINLCVIIKQIKDRLFFKAQSKFLSGAFLCAALCWAFISVINKTLWKCTFIPVCHVHLDNAIKYNSAAINPFVVIIPILMRWHVEVFVCDVVFY